MSLNAQLSLFSCRLMISLIFILILGFLAVLGLVQAQQSGHVQIVTGYIDQGRGDIYTLPHLQQGETLYIYAKGTSGNLDPFVGLGNSSANASVMLSYFEERIKQNLAKNSDPYQAIPETADKFLLKWNDDISTEYDSSFQYKIPKSGDYQLFIINSPLNQTFGDYEMLIGLESPEVLTGEAPPTGGPDVAVLKIRAHNSSVAVQELNGSIKANKPTTMVRLNKIMANDTLYVFVQAKSSNLTPIVVLKDYGEKTLTTGDWAGKSDVACLKWTFKNDSNNHFLKISSGTDENGDIATGDYRLLLGINAPEVLTGAAKVSGRSIVLKPTEVNAAIQLEQITGVDQKQANFGAIASLWMEWFDPALAYSPESCECNIKIYNSIDDFVKEEGERFPIFSFRNLQDDRSTQSQIITVKPDGKVDYIERFSAVLSLPDLDLRRYPLDIQKFSIVIDSMSPDDYVVFSDWNKSNINAQLGNEEWNILKFYTNVSEVYVPQANYMNSRFSFNFLIKRHIDYYIFRIFIPILLIIVLTWLTFFLHKDYIKRIEIVGANLLLFIAYNFTIASDLPKLGYLTFLDRIIISTFVMTAVIFAYNVYLRWLSMNEKKELAERLDSYMVWVYLLVYIFGFGTAIIFRA